MDDRMLFWLSRHPCSAGLGEEAIRELADQLELVSVDSDEEVHTPDQSVSSILFIVKGRLKQTLLDLHGRAVEQTYLTAGGQFGILAAAQSEKVPFHLVALEPTTFLRLDFQSALSLARKHPEFQLNLFKMVGTQIRRILRVDRIRHQPAVVGIVHQRASTRAFTQRLMERLAQIEETVCVFSDAPNWNPIPKVAHRPLLDEGRILSSSAIREQITEWTDRGRIVFDVGAEREFERLSDLLSAADVVLWCVDPENWREAGKQLREIQEKVPGWREKINLVWLLDREQGYAPLAPELLDLVNSDFKVSLCDPPPHKGPLLRNGLERIVHLLRGVKIGLALGGGAARGMAHLGVLKALEQNGVVIDMIAGTSAGAMTGTIYASGLDVDYSVSRFVGDLRPPWILRLLPRGEHWNLLYKYRRGRFDPMLRKYLDTLDLQQLPVPMNTITVDLVGGGPVVRDKGDAVEGILESINLPVLSLPICRQGQALVDGGLVNNVPADVLVAKGCNFVIAVSVTARLEKEFASIRPDSNPGRMRKPSTLQTILRGYLVQHVNMNSIGVQPADYVIEPEVTSFGLTEFTRTDGLAARGEEAALKSIEEIKSTLALLDRALFADGIAE